MGSGHRVRPRRGGRAAMAGLMAQRDTLQPSVSNTLGTIGSLVLMAGRSHDQVVLFKNLSGHRAGTEFEGKLEIMVAGRRQVVGSRQTYKWWWLKSGFAS